MVNLTPAEVTKLYLYGENATPTNFASDSVIRPDGPGVTVQQDIHDYLTSGAGRFAVGSLFEVIQKFFQTVSGVYWNALQPGAYSASELFAALTAIRIETVQAIKYASVKDFKRTNIDCCSFVPHNTSETLPISFWDRLSGNAAHKVAVGFLARIVDHNGRDGARPLTAYVALTNCGIPWRQGTSLAM